MTKAKRVLATGLVAVMASGMLTGCGGGRGTEEAAAPAETPVDTPAAVEETAEGENTENTEPEKAAESSAAGGGIVGVALPWLGTQNWAEAEVMFKRTA